MLEQQEYCTIAGVGASQSLDGGSSRDLPQHTILKELYMPENFVRPNYCPNCGGQDVRNFPPTPFGYWCGECKHDWDEIPDDEFLSHYSDTHYGQDM